MGIKPQSMHRLFEKYLIINIDNIQRKYAIRSRYGSNKNLISGPDLQNIIKSDNDKGITLTPYVSNGIPCFATKGRGVHTVFNLMLSHIILAFNVCQSSEVLIYFKLRHIRYCC